MTQDNSRLVECAKWYHHHKPFETTALPDTFHDEEEAKKYMRDALLLEAHIAMKAVNAEPPSNLVNVAIDLDTTNPGIAVRNKGKVETFRSDSVVREIRYDISDVKEADHSQPPQKISTSRLKNFSASALKKLERAHKSAEEKAYYQSLDREDKRAYKEEKSLESKKRKEHKVTARDEASESDNEKDSAKDDETTADVAVDEESCELEDKAESNMTPPVPPKQKKDPLEESLFVDPMGNAPKKLRLGKTGVKMYHESPAPHDRYLTSLTVPGGMHPSIRDTVLQGTPADNPRVVITHGPPGCGKTHTLLEALQSFHSEHPEIRCLICGPTNVCASSLYTRAFEKNLIGCLALAKEHMPPGVPRAQNREIGTSRFVFSTIAGRSGRLNNENFGAVFIDEAGLCPETITWGLLRGNVQYLWMVGDLKQLNALTSDEGRSLGHDRSLMERLCAIGVHSKRLTLQYRMHPEICRYPSQRFYNNELQTHPTRATNAKVPQPYTVLDIRGSVKMNSSSCENLLEAHAAIKKALEFKQMGLETVILVPYTAQLQRVRSLRSGVHAYTIDSYQGKESEAVVLSITRVPPHAGFWVDERRLNVALTRAKHAICIIGHAGWIQCGGPLGDLFVDAKSRSLIT